MDEVFDTDFYIHKEDVDVCWRAQLRGWGSLYVPAAIAHHVRSFRPGPQNRHSICKQMRFYATRNRYLLMLKNEISAHFWRCLPAIVSYDLGILGYLLLKERETCPALVAAVALSKRMLLKRRIIQTSRRVSRQDIQHWFE
jgi:GT2 family glycosyltransferase